ncbi:MAG: 1-acyl-sn-glycerol-3-phosphate acyltransferase [candidate division KSB1 bacterium]|nr:1-acyl-sn-glycerol-3-phosphate acyltransferase [candidate division KSB1 bacterium]
MVNIESPLYLAWQRGTQKVLKTQHLIVSGLKNMPLVGSCLLTPNHLNWKDVFFIAGVIPRQIHYVATHELFHIKECQQMILNYAVEKLGTWIRIPMKRISKKLARIIVPRVRQIGTIPIRRKNHDKRFFELAKDKLRNGKLVCIFPEGGVSLSGKLRRFKWGAAKMVYDLLMEGIERIPVIPVGMKGTEKMFFPGRNLFLRVGKPLYIDDFLLDNEKETLSYFSDILREKVNELIEDNDSVKGVTVENDRLILPDGPGLEEFQVSVQRKFL